MLNLDNNKDWTGNSKAVFSTLSTSNHSDIDRQSEDYYATPPHAVIKLLEKEKLIITYGNVPLASYIFQILLKKMVIK